MPSVGVMPCDTVQKRAMASWYVVETSHENKHPVEVRKSTSVMVFCIFSITCISVFSILSYFVYFLYFQYYPLLWYASLECSLLYMFAACINGYSGDGSTCTACPANTYLTTWTSSTTSVADCTACTTGYSTAGSTGATAVTDCSCNTFFNIFLQCSPTVSWRPERGK